MYVGKIIIKGIVSIISRSPLFKNGIELFITRPLKPLFDNVEDNLVIIGLKILNSDNAYFFAAVEIAQVTFVKKPQLKIISFQNFKH